jgi:hypothetical protein
VAAVVEEITLEVVEQELCNIEKIIHSHLELILLLLDLVEMDLQQLIHIQRLVVQVLH